jgi:tRNA-2-methylthio-N6-dimethylallyladenosine synthase
MEAVRFDFSFMFVYSERPGTPAAKKMRDDVSPEVKKRRLQEIIDLQNRHSLERNRRDIQKMHRVLAEGPSKRSDENFQGRNSANKVVVFPREDARAGDYIPIWAEECTSATLTGRILKD